MTEYKGIGYEKYHGRYVIISNKDLLKLGLRTEKNIQAGHKGYLSLERLKSTIDKNLSK